MTARATVDVERLVRATLALVVLIALLALLGWALDVHALRAWLPGVISMKANTAVVLILLAAAALLASRRAASVAVAAFAGLVVAATLSQLVFGIDLGIDQLLVADAEGGDAPGRMAPNTSIALLALAASLLLARAGARPAWSEVPAIAALGLGVLGMIGYALGVAAYTGLPGQTAMAPNTAVAIVMLAGGVVLADARHSTTSLLRSPSTAGTLARRFVPALLLLPVLLAIVRGLVLGFGLHPDLVLWLASAVEIALLFGIALLTLQQLERREGIQSRILDSVKDHAVYLLDARGQILTWNAGAVAITGYEPREVVGRHWSLVYPDGTPAGEVPDLRAAAGREAMQVEGWRQRKDGSRFWGSGTITPLRRADGALEGFVKVTRDLTDAKRAQDAIAASEAALREAQAVAHLGSWELDLVQNKLTWSDEIYRIFGLEPQQGPATYEGFLARVHKDDRAAVDKAYRESVAKRQPYTIEHRVVTPDGTLKFVHERCRTDYDADGKPLRSVGTVQDVTERHLAEDALRESETRYRMLAENASDLVTVTDDEARFTYVSPSALGLLGYEPRELLGKTAALLVHPADVGVYREWRPQVLAGGAPPLMARLVRKDGTAVWIEARARAIRDDGHFRGLVSVSRDITARRAAEEEVHRLNAELEQRVVDRTRELEAALKELEAFSYSVSHDLRAPLRAVDGFSQTLLMDYRDKLDEEGRDSLQRIRAASQRMGALIDDILKLSRVSRAELHQEDVDVSALAAELLAELRAQEPHRVVETHIEPGLVVRGDPTLLRSAFQNLLDNAWKFTSKKPRATIEVGRERTPEGPALFVRDDGAGFDPQYAAKLFGAFQRLHRADEYPGNGIGLATVKRIVARHGGKVWAEGQVEKGATFYLTLPTKGAP